jgi:membrane associated rhomboid family serine protease
MDEGQQPVVEHLAPNVAIGPPTPTYTYILIGSIIAVFIAQLLFGDALQTISLTELAGDERSAIAAGFVKQYFLGYHEYWRILTGAAVHGGLLHVAMNCYAFWMFGRIVEMLSNRAHLAIVFLLSCIGGGFLSFFFCLRCRQSVRQAASSDCSAM